MKELTEKQTTYKDKIFKDFKNFLIFWTKNDRRKEKKNWYIQAVNLMLSIEWNSDNFDQLDFFFRDYRETEREDMLRLWKANNFSIDLPK